MDIVGLSKGFMALNFSEIAAEIANVEGCWVAVGSGVSPQQVGLGVTPSALDSHSSAIVTSNADDGFPVGIQRKIFPIQFLDSWKNIPAAGLLSTLW